MRESSSTNATGTRGHFPGRASCSSGSMPTVSSGPSPPPREPNRSPCPWRRLGSRIEPRIVDGSAVERAKPAPDLLLLAADRLGVRPEATWYVGDSTWDMLAAMAAGMRPIAVSAGAAVEDAELRDAGAAIVIGTLDDLELAG